MICLYLLGILVLIGILIVTQEGFMNPLIFVKDLKKYDTIETYDKRSAGVTNLLNLKDLEKYLNRETTSTLLRTGFIEVMDGKQLRTIYSHNHGRDTYIRAKDLPMISECRFVKGHIVPKMYKSI